MTHASRFLHWMRPVAVGALGALLAACGGGGGGEPEPPVVIQKIDLTVANRDTVSHAVVGGALGIGGADVGLPGAVGAAMHSRVKETAKSVKARPMLVASDTALCLVSGSLTLTIDDRDNNGTPSPGDVITLAFNRCSNTPSETVNGTMSLALTNVLSTTDFDAKATFTALLTEDRQTNQVHSVTLDGTMLAAYREQSGSRNTMRLTTEGGFTVGLVTPVFSDTVTLASGFTQDIAEDTAAMPPSGGGGPGRSVATVTGDLRSANAGGWVSVKTDEAVVSYAGDRFPRSGTLQVNGQKGEMHLIAQDTVTIRCDLDDDDDGAIEDSMTASWEWMV